MSGFLSPKYLRLRDPESGRDGPIDIDTPCRGCGYNLRGLTPGTRCPECGLEMQPSRQRGRASFIAQSDPSARQRIIRGLRISAIGLGLMAACRVWLLLPLPGRGDLVVVDIVALVSSMIWLAGVMLVTSRELDVYGGPMQLARWFVRGSQVLWPIAFGAVLYYDINGGPGPAHAIWSIGRIIAGLGVLVFLAVLSVPAQDADCDDEANRLMAMFWALLIVSPLAGWLPRGIAPTGVMWVLYGLLGVVVVLWTILMGVTVQTINAVAGAAAAVHRDLARRGGRQERVRQTREELSRDIEDQVRQYPD